MTQNCVDFLLIVHFCKVTIRRHAMYDAVDVTLEHFYSAHYGLKLTSLSSCDIYLLSGVSGLDDVYSIVDMLDELAYYFGELVDLHLIGERLIEKLFHVGTRYRI